MIELIMIRHGMTQGNRERRYLGSTDEVLCQEGILQLEEKKLAYHRRIADVQMIFSSPMKRCLETAEVFFPGKNKQIIDEYRECHFGDFENKNHQELKGNPEYQKFIDSGGREQFPNGESRIQFQNRCLQGFQKMMDQIQLEEISRAVLFLHGGTIMSILSYLPYYGGDIQNQPGDYFDYMCKNGEGYKVYVQIEEGKVQFKKVEQFFDC